MNYKHELYKRNMWIGNEYYNSRWNVRGNIQKLTQVNKKSNAEWSWRSKSSILKLFFLCQTVIIHLTCWRLHKTPTRFFKMLERKEIRFIFDPNLTLIAKLFILDILSEKISDNNLGYIWRILLLRL